MGRNPILLRTAHSGISDSIAVRSGCTPHFDSSHYPPTPGFLAIRKPYTRDVKRKAPLQEPEARSIFAASSPPQHFLFSCLTVLASVSERPSRPVGESGFLRCQSISWLLALSVYPCGLSLGEASTSRQSSPLKRLSASNRSELRAKSFPHINFLLTISRAI
jgi:hypothetical protein